MAKKEDEMTITLKDAIIELNEAVIAFAAHEGDDLYGRFVRARDNLIIAVRSELPVSHPSAIPDRAPEQEMTKTEPSVTDQQMIALVEGIRRDRLQRISEGSADGYWDHLKPTIPILDAIIQRLKERPS